MLVAGLHMDAAGAAIATVLAQAVSAIFAVILLAKGRICSPLPDRISESTINAGAYSKSAFHLPFRSSLHSFPSLHCALLSTDWDWKLHQVMALHVRLLISQCSFLVH